MSHKAAACSHGGRHRRLEVAVADKADDGMEALPGNIQALGERLAVAEVLSQRIGEAGFVAVDLLGPGCVVFAAENPAFHVFRFHHEDAMDGNEQMIDLGGSLRRREGDIVQGMILAVLARQDAASIRPDGL